MLRNRKEEKDKEITVDSFRKKNGEETNNSSNKPKAKTTKPGKSLVSTIFYRCVYIVLFILGVLFSMITYLLLTRVGLGKEFSSQTIPPPLLNESSLEIVAELPIPPGNLAISQQGRIFFTFHPQYQNLPSYLYNIAELINQTNYRPFPSLSYQKANITSVLSIRIDHLDRLWILDYAHHGTVASPKLFAFSLQVPSTTSTSFLEDSPIIAYTFPSHIAGFGSFLNDLQIDIDGKTIYIADTSILAMTPSLIVYSTDYDSSIRLLSQHVSMYGESVFFQIFNKNNKQQQQEKEEKEEKQKKNQHTKMSIGPLGMKIHIDSIALDRYTTTTKSSSSLSSLIDIRKLYFGAVTNNNLYAIPISHLQELLPKYFQLQNNTTNTNNNNNQSKILNDELSKYVEVVSKTKGITDGLTMDFQHQIYFTAVEHSAILIGVPQYITMTPDISIQTMQYVTLIQSEKYLRWPDGLCFGHKQPLSKPPSSSSSKTAATASGAVTSLLHYQGPTDGLFMTASNLHYALGKPSDIEAGLPPYHILRISAKTLNNVVIPIKTAAAQLSTKKKSNNNNKNNGQADYAKIVIPDSPGH
jgi:hypothetical protein